jgi:hypothetical protein
MTAKIKSEMSVGITDEIGERPASHPFGTIAAETVQAIGDGNLNAGRKVLTRFVSMVRNQHAKAKAA